MNKHDIELPPLPSPLGIVDPEGTEGMAQYTVSDLANYAKAYAMDAIAPYKQRIAEMEAELEAIGAGGVDGRRITPSNTSAKITERSQAYLDGNLDADEHAAFIKWAREAHDYPDYARLILDSEWCQGAVAGWQGAIEADRKRRGEPVGEIRPDDQSGDEVWAEIWADLPPGTKLYAEPVQKAQKECSKDAERSESEGWRLVPKELIDFLDAKEHHLPVEDRHVLSIMLAAAPKFGEDT